MSTSHRLTLEVSPVLAGLTVITAVCTFCVAEGFVPVFVFVFITRFWIHCLMTVLNLLTLLLQLH
jgi:hypothetical protein